ncbi:MAG: class I SAM-dependent methyltransferase [Chloroflexi bacterium]|nr:class I SAM-dependent methyltransferase [Chloroflexota bacterium]
MPTTNIFAGQSLPELIPGGSLFNCHECELRFKFPQIQPAELKTLYSLTGLDHWQSDSSARAEWGVARDWILATPIKFDLLDVGCFDGRFFSTLPPAFKFSGVEINPQAAEQARQKGIEIIGTDFQAIEGLPSDAFDVVTAFDVVEHITDPAGFLKQAVRVVRPGGLIIISTGNALSLPLRLLGSRHYFVVNAEHVSFISPQWCKRLAGEIGVTLIAERRFSHAIFNNIYLRIKQIALNIMYRFFLPFFVGLRRQGLSDKNVNLHPELALLPPNWMTAKDHFIVKFQKQ